ncbi:hypothetical protein M1432_03185 [Patescibacteria group bacterium]|nr:hypothetical protein [Patescibacteria group bacterium]
MGETIIKTKDFIKRLQRSNERTKRRYVYGASAALMVVVVVLWLLYLNITLPTAVPGIATSTAETSASETAPTGQSFFGTLGRGAAIVWGEVAKGVGNIGGLVGGAWQGFQKQIQKTNTFEVNATSTQ